jgi:hypothetical protein
VQSSLFSTVCWKLNRLDKCAQNQEVSNKPNKLAAAPLANTWF